MTNQYLKNFNRLMAQDATDKPQLGSSRLEPEVETNRTYHFNESLKLHGDLLVGNVIGIYTAPKALFLQDFIYLPKSEGLEESDLATKWYTALQSTATQMFDGYKQHKLDPRSKLAAIVLGLAIGSANLAWCDYQNNPTQTSQQEQTTNQFSLESFNPETCNQ